jgi:hypothetical protein
MAAAGTCAKGVNLLWKTFVPAMNRPSLVWSPSTLTEEDSAHSKKEAMEKSPFDPFHLRESMYTANDVRIVVKECALAKVIVYHTEARDPTPWALWGRIFQAMGAPKDASKWRIVWFAHPQERIATASSGRTQKPGSGAALPPGPGHINGGYTYPCTHNTVIVYRKEEASRVLLHELLHASCTDDPSLSVEEREARTEAWAEVFLIAILAKGSLEKAERLWSIQADYISNQHTVLRLDYGVKTPADYVWRYTLGREAQFRRLGLQIPTSSSTPSQASQVSLRLTSPRILTI